MTTLLAMPDFTPGFTPPHHHARMVGLTILAFIGLIALVFMGFFVYYLWQFKYGSTETLTQTANSFNQKKFTTAQAVDTDAPKGQTDLAPFIRPTNPVKGTKNAKVTILAFVDFECPFCREGYDTFQKVTQKYGSAVRVVFKQLPLSGLHPQAREAANASACAQAQGKFWEYYDVLFQTKDVTHDGLLAAATQLHLNKDAFSTCLAAEKYEASIEEDMTDAVTLGVRGTPTYFINSHVIEGVVDSKIWDDTILSSFKK